MAALVTRGLPSAGLFAGPVAWIVDTQANYSLVPWICACQLPLVPIVALAMILVSLAGGFLSWRAFAAGHASVEDPTGGRPHRFVAAIGVAMAVLFALVILMQGAAGLFLHGCER